MTELELAWRDLFPDRWFGWMIVVFAPWLDAYVVRKRYWSLAENSIVLAECGDELYAAVEKLEKENAELKADADAEIAGKLRKDLLIAAERIAIQSELLARAAQAKLTTGLVDAATRVQHAMLDFQLTDQQIAFLQTEEKIREAFGKALVDGIKYWPFIGGKRP